MLNHKLYTALAVFTLLLTACSHHSKFTREDWDYGDGIEFPYRDAMVDDLLKNHPLKGLKYGEVIHLLHRPQYSSPTEMVYEIDEIRKPTSPHYVKKLILSMKDSVVTEAKIYEHSDKKK